MERRGKCTTPQFSLRKIIQSLRDSQCPLCFEELGDRTRLMDHRRRIHPNRFLKINQERSSTVVMDRPSVIVNVMSRPSVIVENRFVTSSTSTSQPGGKESSVRNDSVEPVRVTAEPVPVKVEPVPVIPEPVYTCEICGVCYKRQRSLISHQSAHIPRDRYPCRYCKATYVYKKAWENHEQIHELEAQLHYIDQQRTWTDSIYSTFDFMNRGWN